MSESPREQAFETVAGLLETLTDTRHWGGQYVSRPKVIRHFTSMLQEAELPILALDDGEGPVMTFGTTGGVGRYFDVYPITIYGYIHGDDAVSPRTWAERLRYDVFLTLARAVTPIGQLRGFDFSRPQLPVEHLDLVGMFAWPVVCVIDDEVEVG
jgi:hypothetical protein